MATFEELEARLEGLLRHEREGAGGSLRRFDSDRAGRSTLDLAASRARTLSNLGASLGSRGATSLSGAAAAGAASSRGARADAASGAGGGRDGTGGPQAASGASGGSGGGRISGAVGSMSRAISTRASNARCPLAAVRLPAALLCCGRQRRSKQQALVQCASPVRAPSPAHQTPGIAASCPCLGSVRGSWIRASVLDVVLM